MGYMEKYHITYILVADFEREGYFYSTYPLASSLLRVMINSYEAVIMRTLYSLHTNLNIL